MRIRQPGVERPHRDLDGKGDGKSPKGDGFNRGNGHPKKDALQRGPALEEDQQVKGTGNHPDHLDRQEQTK